MSKLKFAIAMIAAGGAAAAASQANAAVIETFNYAAPTDGSSFSYDITLAGALAPQFSYSGGTEFVWAGPFTGNYVKHHLNANGTARLNPNVFTDPGLPGSSELFGAQHTTTYAVKIDSPLATGDTYYHLTFDAGATNYLGTAKFTGDHTLESITYAAGAPEPEAWALLILGAGLAGAAIRHQRRRQLVAIER